MSNRLTERIIKQWCGKASYEKGHQLYRGGRVHMLKRDLDNRIYDAEVADRTSGIVRIRIDEEGDIIAECSCGFHHSTSHRCGHMAAVLLTIQELEQPSEGDERKYPSLLHGTKPGEEENGLLTPRAKGNSFMPADDWEMDPQIGNRLLGLFADPGYRHSSAASRFDTREILQTEFILKLIPFSSGKNRLGIEMRVGQKRLYAVHRIRDFLECVRRLEPCTFTKNFTYDPERHGFKKEDDDLLQELIRIYDHERMVQQTFGFYSPPGKKAGSERMLFITPSFWPKIKALAAASGSCLLSVDGILTDKLQAYQEPLPIRFEVEPSGDTKYVMHVQGLDRLQILEEYGAAVVDGKLAELTPQDGARLSEMKELLERTYPPAVPISGGIMESMMEKVIPGLMKLGSVHIAKAVSDKMIRSPLKAKLYLDRVKGRLLAGLDFQYGDIVINPLDGNRAAHDGSAILVRDGEREQRILRLMEEADFAKTDGGYYMNDEDAEFEFLHHIVPELEKLLTVYATSAVKERIFREHAAPKLKVDIDERTDWLELKFELDGIPESEIRSLIRSLEEKRKYHRLPSGALMPLEGEALQAIIAAMNRLGAWSSYAENGTARLPAVQGLQLLGWESASSSVQLGKSLRQMLQHVKHPDDLDFPVPPSLEPVLRDYQKYGYQWMRTLAHYRFGGILADDMGLGKTVQSIAFVLSLLPEIRKTGEPVLIVAPASLLYNWQSEIARFAPEIRAAVMDGSRLERKKLIRSEGEADVWITSYQLLRMDMADYAKRMFHAAIFDEAQAFKNDATQTAQAVKTISSRYRFALTGTPMENRMEELWSIYDAVFPALFGGRKAFQDLPRETVATRIRPFLLRRLKSDVLKELPDKIETLQSSALLLEQKKLYTAYLAKLRQETLKHLAKDGFQKSRIRILAGLTRLRQICCHPALFVEGYEGSSAKFEQLLETLAECLHAGRRVLVFSQFTTMLKLISQELGRRGVPFFYLDGQTPPAERASLCSRFNEGEREIFLISLKAGGTGLNLTGADTVILYDLWWNPAVEEQAADRAHRIGQKKIVQVIRMVARDTIEDKMITLQQKKKDLIDEVIQSGEDWLPSWTEEDIRELLMLQP
ncbi:DEAD/DEAH box helicase [Paenibacillus sp. FSL K6-1566]|uniref:DEAD/DEAH box helicase n=1 Tax=Paenibacillus sp. FSL K6-1566 TaxID=2954515 RepID=UPI003100E11C